MFWSGRIWLKIIINGGFLTRKWDFELRNRRKISWCKKRCRFSRTAVFPLVSCGPAGLQIVPHFHTNHVCSHLKCLITITFPIPSGSLRNKVGWYCAQYSDNRRAIFNAIIDFSKCEIFLEELRNQQLFQKKKIVPEFNAIQKGQMSQMRHCYAYLMFVRSRVNIFVLTDAHCTKFSWFVYSLHRNSVISFN